MMNADCLQCDRLIRLQWDGAFRRGKAAQPLVWEGLEEKGEEKEREESVDRVPMKRRGDEKQS